VTKLLEQWSYRKYIVNITNAYHIKSDHNKRL